MFPQDEERNRKNMKNKKNKNERFGELPVLPAYINYQYVQDLYYKHSAFTII